MITATSLHFKSIKNSVLNTKQRIAWTSWGLDSGKLFYASEDYSAFGVLQYIDKLQQAPT